MIKKYKKPVVIEALKWNGKNIKEVVFDFVGHAATYCIQEGLTINTLEGKIKVDIGNFIIKGVKGEFYTCKPDIFEKTYKEVDN